MVFSLCLKKNVVKSIQEVGVMKFENTFQNDFTMIKEDGEKFSFNKSEQNQYYIFDSIELAMLTNQAIFLHTSSPLASEWNVLLTLPSDPTIFQQKIIEEIVKEYNSFARFTTKGYMQNFYSFKGSQLGFDDFDYPKLNYISDFPFSNSRYFSIPRELEYPHLYTPLFVNENSIMHAFQNGKIHDSIVGYAIFHSDKFKLWLPSTLSFYQRCMLFNCILPLEDFIQNLYIYTTKPFSYVEEDFSDGLYLQINFLTDPNPIETLS